MGDILRHWTYFMNDNTLSTKLSSDNILLNFKNPPISKHCKVLLLTQFGKPEKKLVLYSLVELKVHQLRLSWMHVVDTSKENQLIWADSIRSSEYYLKYKENVARGKEEYIGL